MKNISASIALVAIALVSLLLSSCGTGGSNRPAGSTESTKLKDQSSANSMSAQGETARLKLSNKFYRPIVVRLERLGETGRRDVTVPARSSESIRLKAGTYKYIAVAEGFRPISKYKEIEARRSYTLYF